jgi:hypothetical protein
MCAEGSSGVLCSVCGKREKFYARNQIECVACPAAAVSYVSLVVILFALVAAVTGTNEWNKARIETLWFPLISPFTYSPVSIRYDAHKGR